MVCPLLLAGAAAGTGWRAGHAWRCPAGLVPACLPVLDAWTVGRRTTTSDGTTETETVGAGHAACCCWLDWVAAGWYSGRTLETVFRFSSWRGGGQGGTGAVGLWTGFGVLARLVGISIRDGLALHNSGKVSSFINILPNLRSEIGYVRPNLLLSGDPAKEVIGAAA